MLAQLMAALKIDNLINDLVFMITPYKVIPDGRVFKPG
jgi:hypothetical protein